MEEAAKGADTKSPVILHQNDKNEWNISLDFKGGKINTKDILFTTTQNDKGSISFKANTPDGKTIIQSYSLVGESYNIEYSIQLPGSASSLSKMCIRDSYKTYQKYALSVCSLFRVHCPELQLIHFHPGQ